MDDASAKAIALLRHAALFYRRGETAHATIPFVQIEPTEALASAMMRGDDMECAEIIDALIEALVRGGACNNPIASPAGSTSQDLANQ